MARKDWTKRVKMKLPKKIKKGEIIEVRVIAKYPSTTGLKIVDEEKMTFERDKIPVYLKVMEVFYGDEKITTFHMTSATSPDPLIRFKVKADKEATIRIVFHNEGDKTAEVSKNVKFK
ncbi:MAG: thiosulfate oxidation carrier complex protein SoxZ [Nitrospinota bacterium]